MKPIIVEFEGRNLECEHIEIDFEPETGYEFRNLKPGDTYIGRRNVGWKMAQVSERLWPETCAYGYIYGEVNGDTGVIYPYNVGECLKVVGGLE